eukprot:Clim_evm38s230 gene=Clim_evmTU38s230
MADFVDEWEVQTDRGADLRQVVATQHRLSPAKWHAQVRKLDPELLVCFDVRSPIEFKKSHYPPAVNVPLFTDSERAEVGTIFKTLGRQQALHQGLEFVRPKMEQYLHWAKENSEDGRKHIYMYCARGGMRSGSLAWYFSQCGLKVTLLDGGYKAYRERVRAELRQVSLPPFVMLSGPTGCGKSLVLRHLQLKRGQQMLDLEALANHRGSVFGSLFLGSQPTQAMFENVLLEQLLDLDVNIPTWCEAEGGRIGIISVDKNVLEHMTTSPLMFRLEIDREERKKIIMEEYGPPNDNPMDQAWQVSILQCIDQIKKRLGGKLHKELTEQIKAGDWEQTVLELLDYYDRTYRTLKPETLDRHDHVETLKWEGPFDVDAISTEFLKRLERFQKAHGFGRLDEENDNKFAHAKGSY